MNRDERVRRFGIECLGPDPSHDGIFFRAGTWRPGGEYILKLIIRNVSTSVKKLKYKLPSTRYFSMVYPEPITLSPGIFHEVDVVFRPVEYEPYDDTIYIKMLDGIDGNGFHVPVRATIDNLSLEAPEGLDLGYCATHQITQTTFRLVNTGEIDAPYEWDIPAPFVLSPAVGVVPTGSFHEITLSIRPVDASVFVAQAVCRVGQGVHAIIPRPVITTRLSAIGKFAHLTVSDALISFEEVTSGVEPIPKEIVLYNQSVVPAEFELIRFDADRDEVFEISPQRGELPPRSELPVTIKYHARAMGVNTLDRYAFRTPARCDAPFTVKGTSMPPRVSLFRDVAPRAHRDENEQTSSGHNPNNTMSSSLARSSPTGGQLVGTLKGDVEAAPLFSLNFRDIELGRVETRLLYLCNDSAREVPFFVLGDVRGVFQMSPRQGVIPPLVRNFPVKVTFIPLKPINYYRRFFVLVGDALPLFYDCLGTGFIRAKGEIKEQRPAPIRHAHVQAYRNRVLGGCGALSPDELDALYAERERVMRALENGDDEDFAEFEDEDEYQDNDDNISNNMEIVRLRRRERVRERVRARLLPLEFFAHVGRVGTRALAVATLPRPVTRTGESTRTLVAPAHEFFLSPSDATAREVVLNRSICDFGFTPFRSRSAPQRVLIHNHTHGKVVVQWSIPIVHNDDGNHTESTVSQTGLGSSLMRSTKEKEIVTVDGAERAREELQAFAVSPSTAEIPAGASQSFDIVFTPKQSQRNFLSELEAFVFFKNQRTFRLVNDHSLTPPWCLTLTAVGHTFAAGQLLAKARFAGGAIARGKLVFPCAYVGESVFQTFMICNTSNLPSTFRVELGWKNRGNKAEDFADNTKNAKEREGVFTVNPTVGEIDAESFVLICVRFSPAAHKKYTELLRLVLNGDDNGGKLLLEGQGATPFLIVPELLMDNNTGVDALAVTPPEAFWGLSAQPVPRERVPQGVLGVLFIKPTCVGLTNARKITLKNASRLPCKFRLRITRHPHNAHNTYNADEGEADEDANTLRLSCSHGVLKGNDSCDVFVTFAPRQVKLFTFSLVVDVYPIGGKPRRILDANQPGIVDPPERLQSFSITLQAKGEIGAITFDPVHTPFDVRLVHTSEEKNLWLENTADADLQYTLYYREEFLPDRVDGEAISELSEMMRLCAIDEAAESATSAKNNNNDNNNKTSVSKKTKSEKSSTSFPEGVSAKSYKSGKTTIVEEGESGSSRTLRNNDGSYSSKNNNKDSSGSASFEHSLLCGAPSGVIAARSRLRVTIRYRPVKSGLFSFSVYAHVRSLRTGEGEVESVELTNDEAALLRVAGAEIALAGETAREEERARVEEKAQTLLSLPLSATITGRAAFPKLLFEDIRADDCAIQIADIDPLWTRFSLPRLNYDLSVPLTLEEVRRNTLSRALTPQELGVYVMEFAPAVLHTATQSVSLCLRNHGYLETCFSIHLPNEKQLQLENWCDEDNPSQELNRLIAIIEELKLFTIEPREGRLSPGENCTLRVSYQHSSLKYNGIHNLPVLVKLAQGKQFFVDLRGRTLAPALSPSLALSSSVAMTPGNGGLIPNNSLSAVSRRSSTRGAGENMMHNTSSASLLQDLLAPAAAADILLVLSAQKHDFSLDLSPVPIGLSPVACNGLAVRDGTFLDAAPLQHTELVNVSAHNILYEVFIASPPSAMTALSESDESVTSEEEAKKREKESALARVSLPLLSESDLRSLDLVDSADIVKRDNFHCELLRCANRRGEIREGQSLPLEWYFYPLQAREYLFNVVVRYSVSTNGYNGVGFHNGEMAMNSSSVLGFADDNRNIHTGGNSPSGKTMTSSSRKSSSQALLSSRRASNNNHAHNNNHVMNNNNVKPQYRYLQAVIRVRGFDPRLPRPLPFTAFFIGGRPPVRPALCVPDRPVSLFEDLVDFSLVPQRARVKRILTLVNASPHRSFEFSLDESSSMLCRDELLSIEPTFGKIEPRGRVIVELTLQAMAQAMVVADHVKIMVREVIRGVNKSRGGTRQQIIDKLKCRKVQESEHESVVGRTTFARSVQVLLSEHGEVRQREVPAPFSSDMVMEKPGRGKKKTSKLPSTVSTQGAVVSPDLKQTLQRLCPDLDDEDWEEVNANVQSSDKGESLLLPDRPTPSAVMLPGIPEAPQRGTNAVGPGPTKSVAFHDVPPPRTQQREKEKTPAMSPSRAKLLSSSQTHTQSDLALSRGGTHSDKDRERESVTGTRRTGASQGAYTIIGTTYFLIARLRGEIYSESTIRCILNREKDSAREGARGDNKKDEENTNDNKNTTEDVMLQYLIPQERRAFVPPVGKKFFDAAFVAEQERIASKSRVNIAFVKDRDDELRSVAESVFDALLKNALSLPEMEQTLRETLDEDERKRALPELNTQPSLCPAKDPFVDAERPPPFAKFGVFLREIQPALLLHQTLIIELKHFLNDLQPARAVQSFPAQPTTRWLQGEEQQLLIDEESYAVSAQALKQALREWRLAEEATFQDVLNDLDALTHSATTPSNHSRSDQSKQKIVVKRWTNQLSQPAQRVLEARIASARDLRLAAPSSRRAAEEKRAAEERQRQRERRERERRGVHSRTPSPQRPRSDLSVSPSVTSAGASLSPHSSSRSLPSLREREREEAVVLSPQAALQEVARNDEFAAIASEALNALFVGLMKHELAHAASDA